MTRKHPHVTYGTLNSCFDLIGSHQQWSPPLEIKLATPECRNRISTNGLSLLATHKRCQINQSWCAGFSGYGNLINIISIPLIIYIYIYIFWPFWHHAKEDNEDRRFQDASLLYSVSDLVVFSEVNVQSDSPTLFCANGWSCSCILRESQGLP